MNGLILVLATTNQAVARSNRAGRAMEKKAHR